MSNGVFVTATGTDAGKTVLAAGLMRGLRARGLRACYMKPVQTGAVADGAGGLSAPDVDAVCRAAGLTPSAALRARMSPYVFSRACSPHLAARLAGGNIRIATLLENARALNAEWERLVVEGAGGALTPLNETETMLDLAAALGFPVLLAAHSGLGALNHVLLSLEALRRRGLVVAGVVLNDTRPAADGDRYIRDDNVAAIETFGASRVLARVPYAGEPPDWAVVDRALENGPLFWERMP
ncbi:MAG: dethiobiotin synthase [Verrucomicrobiota bacterium]|nr:dethiobiotin synthase [Verrucomicrobiota bacterium]